MQLSGGLRERITRRRAGGMAAPSLSVPVIVKKKALSNSERQSLYQQAYEYKRQQLFKHWGLDSTGTHYATLDRGQYALAPRDTLWDADRRARAYADSKYPSGGLSGLGELGTWGYSGASARSSKDGYVASGYLMQSEAQADVNCHDAGGVYVGGRGCHFPPAAPAPAPSNNVTVSPNININPAIQTQISPQISPAFQQAFQPSNSPMTAGTTQNMPTSQNAAPPPPVPQYQAPAPAAPTAAPDNSAALLDQQRQMYEAFINKLTAPGGAPTSSLPAPAPVAPPMPTYQSAPLPIQSSSPQPFDTFTPPVAGDVSSGLPQVGMSSSGQTAAAVFAAQNQKAPAVPIVQQAKSNLPLIFAILAGAGILFIGSGQHKGKRHAT